MTLHLLTPGCAAPGKTGPILTACCNAETFYLRSRDDDWTFDPSEVTCVA